MGRNSEDWYSLADSAGQLGNQWATARRERREQAEQQAAYQRAYAEALEQAKETGVFPEKFQRAVAEDRVGAQVGVKVVALRELGKHDPEHPLVNSDQCRDIIKRLTIRNYCKAGRPGEGAMWDDFAPSDTVSQRVFADFTPPK